MEENWDRLPHNLGEVFGPIERKSFTFNYKRFEVWQGGACIYSGKSNGQIISKLINGESHVTIDDATINNHIFKHFTFGQISTNGDRIIWSKDMFNENPRTQKNNPDISSLFFKQGILNKVTYTIHDPNTLVEFYS